MVYNWIEFRLGLTLGTQQPGRPSLRLMLSCPIIVLCSVIQTKNIIITMCSAPGNISDSHSHPMRQILASQTLGFTATVFQGDLQINLSAPNKHE